MGKRLDANLNNEGMPEKGCTYYYVRFIAGTELFMVQEQDWHGSCFDKYRLVTGNFFLYRNEARDMANKFIKNYKRCRK